MRVTSNDFKDGDYLSNDHVLSAAFGFGCAGGNESPHLAWSDVPEGTRSFAVTCFDPDAPTGSGFWHWVVVNVHATVHELPRGAGSGNRGLHASALQVRTDFGAPGYGRPSPPLPLHRIRRQHRHAARRRRYFGRRGWLQPALRHAGEGHAAGPLQALARRYVSSNTTGSSGYAPMRAP